ncbi:toxin-antitoxin system, toxin component family protein [Streptomyces sp. NBC_00243]|uniref:toxin-antitoxin system, toxin component family protein n=1 Tax=Streptomyces sp. NBC_00243 TaxID=2975688 RepID=UPI002DD9E828|nr:toxin-antitoxin system, toxin component family protein [Streptomyces sp. NBC_00243]WRZ24344.1 toxin-antitoxin system, toxin component family protein [Streptomyces sp. NBC_00243]
MRLARGVSRVVAALRPGEAPSEMRGLALELSRALSTRIERTPVDVRELAAALCEEMGGRRDGRPVRLRFERFPDEFEVTGLWLEFHDFDLIVIEERAETVQQLVILGHELWHMRQGHHNHHVDGAAAAARTLSDGTGWQEIALTVAARNGSHAADEAEAEDFGLRLASVFRSWVTGLGTRSGPVGPVGRDIQASLGYRGRED